MTSAMMLQRNTRPQTEEWRLGSSRPPILASHIPISYITMIGSATSAWLNGSKVGVISAPMMNATTTAYRRFLARKLEVSTPIFDRK